MSEILAIITARGGSKRIPRKNIKMFFGQPIIKYSIDAALQSGCFDEVMVSTDDIEIAELAQQYKAKVPFIRSQENANDYSTTADVLLEVLNEYKKAGRTFKYACCIYPTAPFITAEKLKNAFDNLTKNQSESVVPIVRFSSPILRSFKSENGLIKMNWPEYLNIRSQELPTAYHDAGQFYFFETDSFLKSKKIFTDNTIGIEMPESEVQDIDNEEDWKMAEIKFQIQLEKANK
jgi:N-acylneuraminate cytidylyltransferase